MKLCSDCEKLTIKALQDDDVPLKDNLATLIVSARNGCSFCSMCWARFQKDCTPETIQRHLRGEFEPGENSMDWKIYLQAELHERGGHFWLNGKGSHIQISSGRFPRYSSEPGTGTRLYTHLSVFADPGTAAARYLPDRFSTQSRNPNLRISWTKQMLSRCQSGHPRCGNSRVQTMPTRVIDVGCPSQGLAPFVFVTNGCADRYVALSYCWGDGVKPETRLKKATYDGMLRYIDEVHIARTHQEALRVTRELGFQYIWIDALCIIQDSKEDWKTESANMTRVYGNSELTLVAGRNGNCTLGFIDNLVEPTAPVHQLEYILPDNPVDTSVCYISLPRSLDRGRVEDRAWCFQESVLSRRGIVYGAEQLIFECQEGTFYEDGTITLREATQEGRYILGELWKTEPERNAAKETMLRRWYHMVDRYSIRSIYDPHDIFAALAGIAKAVQGTLGCRYLAGLWEDDLIRGLLWHSWNDAIAAMPTGGKYGSLALRRPTERNAKNPHLLGQPARRAPSWSWASVEGPVLTNSVQRPEKYRQKYRTATNFCIRPALDQPPRWTNNDSCDVNQMWMRECELEMMAAPVEVACSTRRVPEYSKRTRWWYSPGRIAKRGVLLVAPGHLPERVVGVGLFDVADEKTSPLWCMRVIKEEGLMLRRDCQGKYHRLGVFVVEHEAWFEEAREEKVSLL
ncbi:hypothetical protein A1O3_10055 [Capronia epimyces CBS 606.96]|uniref:Heterokaryon incompatibility domain-containing protein n=1 Tax=Capronia epimyces CBS 606.96 TaxID=1182542 RepID=W9X9L6_9EURO|nr:uncharacterized protein A1O3_10055 [Capronia epimyces CBS 606.96]EXJ76898.1 hypothetical protein A1O3_10055 [Capronia epimyces CBS 606.96]